MVSPAADFGDGDEMFRHAISVFAVSLALAAGGGRVSAALVWPTDRLLPQFPAPAATLDCLDLTGAGGAEEDLFASLEGIVNRAQPRLACVSARESDGKFTWLKIHRLAWNPIRGDEALLKYKNEIAGLVVTDPAQPDTLNLATTLAGLNDELICAPELLAKLTNAPFNFPVKDDLRGKFAGQLQVYEFLLTNCWPRCTHRIFTGLGPRLHGNLRDYAVAVKSAVVWLDPRRTAEAALLAKFFSGLRPAAAVYMGWWPDEEAGLKFAGQRGIPVLASDYFQNGSVFSGVIQPIAAPPPPPPPPLENKIYVAFYFSDGDNVQYMQHRLKKMWDDPARGKIPLGWTVSPLAADLDPAMLNYYWRTATTNDCLVSGPSGAGYARLDFWPAADLNAFTKITEPYLQRSGIRIITAWLRVNDEIGEAFAKNCPSLLGLMSHEGGSFTRVYGRLPVIGFVAGANYADRAADLQNAIAKAARNWNGHAPLFLAVQANAWNLGPTDLSNLAASLDSEKFVVVRPDQLFELFDLSRKKH